MNIEELSRQSKIKGVNLLGTGDFTHPIWLKELKQKLEPADGLFTSSDGTHFMLTTELSLIYTQDKKVRKIHNIIFAPSFEVVDQINEELLKRGRLDYDGRPIFGKFPCYEFVEAIMSISKDCMVVPAHIWTPWFSLFGSNSGFDNIKDCFKDQLKNIHALETGLSSNPAMNWRLSQLDDYSIVSFSDSHSPWPWRLGREATILDVKNLTYKTITGAMKDRNSKNFLHTIEVDPSYGKYHVDGHRNCGISLEPKEALKLNNICPVCRRQLTIGVLHRVEELADREEGFKPKSAKPFKSLIPLSEIISSVLGINQVYSKKVTAEYEKLIKKFGNEFTILLDAPLEELRQTAPQKIAESIFKVREGELKVIPGYDGVYGKPVFDENEYKRLKKKAAETVSQRNLKDF